MWQITFLFWSIFVVVILSLLFGTHSCFKMHMTTKMMSVERQFVKYNSYTIKCHTVWRGYRLYNP